MLSRAQAGRVKALHRRKGREESGEFLVEGIRQVEDLVASPVVPRLALISPSLEDTDRGRDLAARVRAITTAINVSDAELGRLATTETTQGIVVVASIPRITLMDVALRDRALVVVLDAVQDPGNFGTLVRSAEAFGVSAVVALPGTVDPWNPKSVRAAAGTSFRIPIVRLAPLQLAEWAAREEFAIWGAAADGESIAELVVPRRTVLVIGNEGAGLSPLLESRLTQRVAVPIRGAAESLNAAMAGTVLLYLLSFGGGPHA
jgi:TrmH family RNA methyltransferase